jgi:GNAT superfamily N-acetyltransferase
MNKPLTIHPMLPDDTAEALDLWRKQFACFGSHSDVYPLWQNNTGPIEAYIRDRAGKGRAMCARLEDAMVGYLCHDTFNFHGSPSAFCHFAGNASVLEGRVFIYQSLYQELARQLVEKGIASHYFTIAGADDEVKSALFDLGFGAYVMDGFKTFEPLPPREPASDISIASLNDAAELYEVVRDSKEYYLSSPIFLTMQPYPPEELVDLIQNSTIFIAREQGMICGFFNLRIASEDDIFRMTPKGCGMIDEIGAYIRPGFRGKNIGYAFMQAISTHCREHAVPCVHVDYETSNLFANAFWKKYFTPTLLSLKRTVHPDSIGIGQP